MKSEEIKGNRESDAQNYEEAIERMNKQFRKRNLKALFFLIIGLTSTILAILRIRILLGF